MDYVLIPAYQPDIKLIKLCERLVGSFAVIVINDGSDADKASVFSAVRELGCIVLEHIKNMGKGAALKTGIMYLCANVDASAPAVLVTADADGQHKYDDILAVAKAAHENQEKLVLGCRTLKDMPPRSRIGNTLTRWAFVLSTGRNVSDTQTGLRGMARGLWERMLTLAGDRYEYEMNMLLELDSLGMKHFEVPISTVYIDNNSSTHFHGLKDGARVFSRVLSRLVKYCASSIVCAGVDYSAYLLLMMWLTPQYSFIGARVVSSVLNYELNRNAVFKSTPSAVNALKFAVLVAFVMCVGSLAVKYLVSAGVGSLISKIVVDVVLFIFNYIMQNKVIFRRNKKEIVK